MPWFWLALGAIALAALALRLYGLNWDANNHLHPDEREIVFRAMCLTFPGQMALRPGNCDPATTGAGWLLSPASPLNPHFFAYGSLPLYLLAAVCRGLAWLTHLTGGRFVPTDGGAWDDFNHFTLVGRTLSALFDTGSVLLVALLGRRLASRRVGLLAAALVAVLPFEIQVAHFYAVDTVMTFFVLLTLLACVRLAQVPAARRARPRAGDGPAQDAWSDGDVEVGHPLAQAWTAWRGGVFLGLALGLAVASKVSALPLVVPALLAVVVRWRRRRRGDEALLALLGIAAAAILAFILTSPYALIDWHTFVAQVSEQNALSRGQLDYPYVRQFAGTTPFVYEIQQLLAYDMGPALGALGLVGAAWVGWRLWRRWDDDWLPIFGWMVVYFAVVGSAYTKFTRYMLPLFPLLVLCGAAALGALSTAVESRGSLAEARPPQRGGRRLYAAARDGLRSGVGRLDALLGARWRRRAVLALGAIVLASTAFLALALDNIYSTPNTRVQASEWIYDHVAPGASITNEVWDDPLPILVPPAHPGPGFGTTAAGNPIAPGEYTSIPLNLYDPDTPQKADQLAQDLANADVVVISSQRLLRSIPKLPDRYPMTTRYYQLLFAGKLGFRLAAHFENPPHLLGFSLNEAGADESFSVYDHPPVWIFVRQGAGLSSQALLSALTDGVTLPAASSRTGAQKSLLLTPAQIAANNRSPALGVQFPAGSLANRVPLLWWLVVVELLGAVSFPLAYVAFPGLRDRGWGLTKLLGLLVVAYLVWLSASLQALPFTSWTVAGACLLLAGASAAVAWWRRRDLLSFLRKRWRLLAVCEAGFLVAFAFFTWVRALDPDLWHIWRGGEKPMELAFIDSILHSRYFPPADPWFSGGSINYYYYGQYLIALLARLTGIAPTTAFNLAIPLLFAICFTAAFSVVGGLTGRAWAGVAAGIALVVVCNLDGAWQAISQWLAAAAHNPIPPFDYWRSSRVINPPYTINEFPFWSFLYGDLHPHLIDLPIVVSLVAVCASLLVTRRGPWRASVPTLVFATLALGTTGPTNTWDFPTCALLLVAVLILRTLGFGDGSGWRAMFRRLRWPLIRQLAGTAIVVVGLAYLLFLPFYAHYQNFVSGIGTVPVPDPVAQFLTVFGIWLFLLVSFFVVELRDRWEAWLATRYPAATTGSSARAWLLTAATLLVLLIAAALGLRVLLAVLLALGLVLALNTRHSPVKLLTYALLVLGLAITLGTELIYVRDFLDNSPYERMNSVFKFFYQAWVCFALGGALAFAQLAARVLPAGAPSASAMGDPRTPGLDDAEKVDPEKAGAGWDAPQTQAGALAWARAYGIDALAPLRSIWLVAFVLLLAGSLVFVVEGTAVRVQDPAVWAQVQPPPGGIQPQGLSLDGMAYMRGWYPGEYAAITWMNTHISGSPTIIEASDDPYEVHVADYTGLPSVLVLGHEPEQRYTDQVYARQNDVQIFFTTSDPQAALDILHRYDVRYVYVGQREINCPTQMGTTCPPAPAATVQQETQKYQTLVEQGALVPVYQNSGVTIYQVVR